MATLEERVSALEEGLGRDFATPFRAVMVKVDELGRDVREQGRDIREHGRDIRDIKVRLGAIDAHLGAIDTRLNTLDEKMDLLRESVHTQGKQLEQILLLLTNKPE